MDILVVSKHGDLVILMAVHPVDLSLHYTQQFRAALNQYGEIVLFLQSYL